ncbi:hypothetical protein GCM10023311_27000 [Flaviramulus aquimarinus]|uniref:Uncharacterized protein n=1 Tax=Flaviramulus aquimarinus TaxID=1170456 RepID=A0ABP9FN59_9FLAO
MKENADKYLDDLTKKVINESAIETPSFNFTDAVMSQIEELNTSHVTVYKPLISKTTWVLVFIGFLAVILYVLLTGASSEGSIWLNEMGFNVLSSHSLIATFTGFKMSKTLMYAVLLLGIMLSVQISFLKHHFDQRLR